MGGDDDEVEDDEDDVEVDDSGSEAGGIDDGGSGATVETEFSRGLVSRVAGTPSTTGESSGMLPSGPKAAGTDG